MPATITTKELFPLSTDESRINEEVKLRIMAGAIRSWYEKDDINLILYTEWNVIGDQ